MVTRKYDHWWEYAGDYSKDAMKGWGLGALFFLALLGTFVYLSVTKGKEWIDSRIKTDQDNASAAVKNATANETNASTSKQVAEAVTRLTSLQDKMSAQHDTMLIAIRQTAEQIAEDRTKLEELREAGTIPAREIRNMMEQAAKTMAPVPQLREEANRISREHLETTKKLLEAIEKNGAGTQLKNLPASPSPMSGDALKS